MARRSRPFHFGNIEQVTTVVDELRKTVRIYEKLLGFAVERAVKPKLRTSPRAACPITSPFGGLRRINRAKRTEAPENLLPPPPPRRPGKRKVKH